MELERPEISLTSIDLEPDKEEAKRQTRSLSELPERLKGWLEVGTPVVQAINVVNSESDPLLVDYLRNESYFKFFSVHFACDFKPPKDGSFADAWVEIQLIPLSGEAEVVAWSMNPLSAGVEEKVTKTYKLGADIKFVPVEIGGSGECKREYTGKDVHIEAHRLMTDTPSWEFIHTKARPIRGVYLLDLVVRLPSAIQSKVKTCLTANVEDRKFKLFKYRTPFHADAKNEVTVG